MATWRDIGISNFNDAKLLEEAKSYRTATSRYMSDKDILEIVQTNLNEIQPAGFRVDVVPDDVRKDGRWWYVVVKPSDPEVRSFEFNEVLRKVEGKIEDERHLHVLLIPALVD